MPNAVPGFSGGKLPGSSKADTGKEEEDEGKDDQKRQMRSEVTKEIVASVLKEADTVGGGVTGNTGPISQKHRCYGFGASCGEWNGAEEEAKLGLFSKLRTVLKKEMLWYGMKTMG